MYGLTDAATQTVAQYIMKTLRLSGVEVVFGYPGQSNIDALHAARDQGLRYVQSSSEYAAGFAAIGYVLSRGTPTVVCVSKGPAITNLLTPLVCAARDGVPLIAISGNVSASLLHKNGFQEFDGVSTMLAGAAVKAATQVTAAEKIPEALEGLFLKAWTEPQGPVLLDIPCSLWSNACGATSEAIPIPRRKTSVDDARFARVLNDMCRRIEDACRPVLVVGRGARKDFIAIRAIASAHDIPCVHTMGGTGVIASDDSLNGGLLRHNGRRSAAQFVQAADLIVALGTGLDERATGEVSTFAPNAVKIQVDLDAAVLGRTVPVSLRVNASVAAAVEAMSAGLRTIMDRRPWRFECAALAKADSVPPIHDRPLISAREVVEAIKGATAEPIVVMDSGSHKYWLTKYMRWTTPAEAVASSHFGVMGFALPAAIGVSIARPDQTVIAACGDGGLLFSLPELVTAVQERCANLKIVVFNNAGLGSTRDYEMRRGHQTILSDSNGHRDFVAIAATISVCGRSICDRRGLHLMAADINKSGIQLLDCRLDPREPLDSEIGYFESLGRLASGPPMPQPTRAARTHVDHEEFSIYH